MTKIRFRASGVGALMSGGNEISEKQLQKLKELELRKAGLVTGKNGQTLALTAKMAMELEELTEKRDAPFEFGETAKAFIESVWLDREYGYKEQLSSDHILKGHLCEQDSMALIHSIQPSKKFRRKNKHHFKNEWFTGTPDIKLDEEEIIEDIKTCWDIKTYRHKKTVEFLYYAQGQVYMNLTGFRKFRLHYCLVNTPEEILHKLEKRLFYKYGADYENTDYLDACDQMRDNHTYDDIPSLEKVKTFDFEYNSEFIDKLKERVELAREYYKKLSLTEVDPNWRFKLWSK